MVDSGIILRSVSNLLSEIEYLSPSVELRDIQSYVLRTEALNQNLRRLPPGAVDPSVLATIIRGLDEMKHCFEEMEYQFTHSTRRCCRVPRVHTGMYN